MYKNVLEEELKLPEILSHAAQSLIRGVSTSQHLAVNVPWVLALTHQCQQFLTRDPDKRLGANVDGLKGHEFFRGLDWDKVYAKAIRPEYVPLVKGKTDISWLEDVHDINEGAPGDSPQLDPFAVPLPETSSAPAEDLWQNFTFERESILDASQDEGVES